MHSEPSIVELPFSSMKAMESVFKKPDFKFAPDPQCSPLSVKDEKRGAVNGGKCVRSSIFLNFIKIIVCG